MPTVSITTAATVTPPAPRRKLTLATATGLRVELPYAPVGSPLSGLGDRWEEVERAGDRPPLLVPAGPQLATLDLDLEVIDTRRPDTSIELYIYALTLIARGTEPVWIANYGILVGNGWRIADLAVDPFRRSPADNAITGANVTLKLTAASDLKIITTLALTAAELAGTTRPPATPKQPVRSGTVVTVKAGESAAQVAKRTLGASSLWPKLLAANNVRNPAYLVAGARLRVP